MITNLPARIEASEKKVKVLAKERHEGDADLALARRQLFDDLCEAARSASVDEDVYVEKIWRLCFLKRIEGFRTRLESEAKGHNQRKVAQEFRAYLAESIRLLKDFADTLSTKERGLSRILSCLGDLARYKEQLTSEEDKRWLEAEGYYKEAARHWPESGLAQNQLAVLAYYRKRFLVAVYRYERAIACAKPFENARRNVTSLLVELAEGKHLVSKEAHEIFIDKLLRLHAVTLLPESKLALEVAELEIKSLPSNFMQTVYPLHLKGEVLTALVQISFFGLSHGDALGRPVSDSPRSNFGVEVFRAVGCCFADAVHADIAAIKSSSAIRGGLQANLARSLILLHDICGFVRANGFHLMNRDLMDVLEDLEQDLAGLPTDLLSIPMPEWKLQRLDLEGFQPMTRVDAVSPVGDTIGSCARDIRNFVGEFVHAELGKFAVNGELFTTHRPGADYETDEDEEILFRPNFAVHGQMDAQVQAAEAVTNPTFNHFPGYPIFYPYANSFEIQPDAQTWGQYPPSVAQQNVPSFPMPMYEAPHGEIFQSRLQGSYVLSTPSNPRVSTTSTPPGF